MWHYGGPPISNVYQPTWDDIRSWAWGDGQWPEQDWHMFMAEPENLELLVSLVEDPRCQTRGTLLSSLYCTVGHSTRADPRIAAVAAAAAESGDAWVSTWGRRVILVLAHPEDFRDEDWCGLDTYAARPVDRDVGASGDGVGEPRSDPAGGPASD